jgi:peptidyl-prolyl cis-trans isomerase C
MHRRELGGRNAEPWARTEHTMRANRSGATALAVCTIALGLALTSPALTQPAAANTPALSAEEAARRAEVVAHVGTASITVGQLEDAILSQNPFMQQRYVSAEAVRELLDRSLRFELLAAEAQRRGYAEHAAVTLAVKQNTVQALIKQEFDDKITQDSIPADDVKKYYDEHLDEFVRPESRRASLVILATEAEAKALLPEAKTADVRTFRELARTKSVDETNRQRGGDLNYFDASGRLLDTAGESVDVAVAKAAFALKQVGDTSGVVSMADRFALVKLTGQRPAQEDTRRQADERIRMRLWRERRQAAIDAKLDELKKRVKPEVHPEFVDLVQLDTGSALPPGRGLPSGFPHTRPGPIMTPPAE